MVSDFGDIPKYVDKHESCERCMKYLVLGKAGIPCDSFHDVLPIVEVLSSRIRSLSICFSNFEFQNLCLGAATSTLFSKYNGPVWRCLKIWLWSRTGRYPSMVAERTLEALGMVEKHQNFNRPQNSDVWY